MDGRAAYGAGFTAYFLGIPWNVDFARPTDMKSSLGGWQTTFYIGPAIVLTAGDRKRVTDITPDRALPA